MFSSVQCLSTSIQFSEKCSTVIGAAKCLCLINEPQFARRPHVSVFAYNTKCYNVYMLNNPPVDTFITNMLRWVSERLNCMYTQTISLMVVCGTESVGTSVSNSQTSSMVEIWKTMKLS